MPKYKYVNNFYFSFIYIDFFFWKEIFYLCLCFMFCLFIIVAVIMLFIIMIIWIVVFIINGLNHNSIPLAGKDQSQLVGTILFNYAFIVFIPSIVNELVSTYSKNLIMD